MLKEPKNEEQFKPNSNFETIFKLYQFDSELRALVFQAIEQIEIAVRTQIIYHLSHKHGDGFWFLEKDYYQSIKAYNRALSKIMDAVQESKQPPLGVGCAYVMALQKYVAPLGVGCAYVILKIHFMQT